MSENIFKIMLFRGNESEFKNDVIVMGGLPDPELVAEVPERIYDTLYNTLYEARAMENRH